MSAPDAGYRTWAQAMAELPNDATGVRWADGTVECRFRLLHPAGSLVANEGDIGLLLTDPVVECTRCSDACTS